MAERSNVSPAEPDGTRPTLAAAGEVNFRDSTMSTDQANAECSIDAVSVPAEQKFMSQQIAKQWAQDWFAGAAYCPRCKSDDLLAISASSSDDASIVETWTCACGHSWKVEFQETAAAANADAEPAEWIERDESSAPVGGDRPRALSSEARSRINAAIARLCDASFACGEWTRDSEESWADVYRESVAARVALEALLCSGPPRASRQQVTRKFRLNRRQNDQCHLRSKETPSD